MTVQLPLSVKSSHTPACRRHTYAVTIHDFLSLLGCQPCTRRRGSIAQDRSLWHAADDVSDRDLLGPRRTYCFLDDRYDWNQQRAVSPISKVRCKRCNRIEWSTVSKVAEGSEQLNQHGRQPGEYLRVRALAGPQFRWNDSVKNQTGEADGDQTARYSISWRATRLSWTFERTEKMEISRYDHAFVASSPGFFRTGVINVSLHVAGKRPLRSASDWTVRRWRERQDQWPASTLMLE